MAVELRILMIEDNAADVVLINHALRNGGLAFRSKRVDNQETFLHELQHNPPDVILSDHGLPEFDGFTALAIAQNQCPGIPFIFVTGGLGDEAAVEALKCGATDYVLKNRLATHLVPAVQQALRDTEGRTPRRRSEAELEGRIEELQAALAKAVASTGLVLICSACEQVRDEQGRWQTLEEYLLAHPQSTLSSVTCPECAQGKFLQVFEPNP
jgi:two-component system response regulator